MRYRGSSKALPAVLLLPIVLGSAPVFLPVTIVKASSALPSLSISVGYTDDSHGVSGAYPSPWCGASSVADFIGVAPPGCNATGVIASGTTDGGAIRIDNTGSSAVTVQSVLVTLPIAGGGTVTFEGPGATGADESASRPVAFNLWGSFTIPAGKSAILDQTTPGPTGGSNFDTSDYPTMLTCGQKDSNIADAPLIEITIGGVTTRYTDSGRVLDTGGYDTRCLNTGTESEPWSATSSTTIVTSSAVSSSTSTSSSSSSTPQCTDSIASSSDGTTTLDKIAAGTFPSRCNNHGTAGVEVTVQNLKVLGVFLEPAEFEFVAGGCDNRADTCSPDLNVIVKYGTADSFVLEIEPPYLSCSSLLASGGISNLGAASGWCGQSHSNPPCPVSPSSDCKSTSTLMGVPPVDSTIDVTGTPFNDADHLPPTHPPGCYAYSQVTGCNYHSSTTWEIHPVTAWKPSSAASSGGGSGVPEFPVQLGITLLFTTLIVASYVLSKQPSLARL